MWWNPELIAPQVIMPISIPGKAEFGLKQQVEYQKGTDSA
jgi:hypothetical protein